MSFGLLLGASSAAAAVTCVRMGLPCTRLPKMTAAAAPSLEGIRGDCNSLHEHPKPDSSSASQNTAFVSKISHMEAA